MVFVVAYHIKFIAHILPNKVLGKLLSCYIVQLESCLDLVKWLKRLLRELE